jgi:hypothetical protein
VPEEGNRQGPPSSRLALPPEGVRKSRWVGQSDVLGHLQAQGGVNSGQYTFWEGVGDGRMG